MKTNKTRSGIKRARREGCSAVLSGVAEQGLQGDNGAGKGNEGSSHMDSWGTGGWAF